MILRLNESILIEDMRNHPAEALQRLRALLAAGTPARLDPRRKNFYELEDDSRVFYIHICPNGKVLLLAMWDKINPAATCQEQLSTPALAFCQCGSD